ncbi:YihY/virulence factor BrkB family protein [Spiractinospora alimapuensis]|uniref:YihY/virulence factor BrkB family protein n=1 Tax=Spiractinospora alimapuensis TaxID=2820884 RepID=UPI001F2D189C|nr:YihY/virulence factor BrkB family protein [Spiractinospora alimapuensis]
MAEHTFLAARRASPAFDHSVRAVERYSDRNATQLAASVTYFGFLSFFPLIALAFSVLGYVSFMHDEVREALRAAIHDVLPGLGDQLPIEAIERARVGAGVIGLVGLLYSGLGAVSALREALHAIWLKSLKDGPNFVVAKLFDTLTMVVVGIALLASVTLTSTAQAGTHWLLDQVGFDQSIVVAGVTRALGLFIAIAADTVIFLVLFRRLSGTRRPWWMLWRGALLAAVGFELMKLLATFLLRSTLDNPVYASFAVLVGLLVWINLVTRFLLFTAAWTATQPPSDDHYSAPVRKPARSSDAETSTPDPAVRGSRPPRRHPALWGVGAVSAAGVAYAVWRRRSGNRPRSR